VYGVVQLEVLTTSPSGRIPRSAAEPQQVFMTEEIFEC
jgi:hypothetical protein